MKPKYQRGLKVALLMLLLNVILLSSCIDGEAARKRQELTQNYGAILGDAYYDHMQARVEACQTQNVLGLDEFADGSHLEYLEQRVKESDCYTYESFHEEITNLSVGEYTPAEASVGEYTPAEAEAVISVYNANEETYIWIVTFKKDDEVWKITGIRNLPRD